MFYSRKVGAVLGWLIRTGTFAGSLASADVAARYLLCLPLSGNFQVEVLKALVKARLARVLGLYLAFHGSLKALTGSLEIDP